MRLDSVLEVGAAVGELPVVDELDLATLDGELDPELGRVHDRPHRRQGLPRLVIERDSGQVGAAFNEKLVETGAARAGMPLDDEAREALAAMRAIVDSPELWVEFTIERGQVQFINNRQFAHSRTDFKDAVEPHLKRHLIRLWTREEGRRTFHA